MSNPIRFCRKEYLCEVELFLLNRQAAQDHAEAIESLAGGTAALRRRRIRRLETPQRMARRESTPAKAPVSGPITAAKSEAILALSEAEIQTFTWRQARPLRR